MKAPGFDLSDLPTKNDLAAVGREIRLEFRADMERLARRLTMWTSSMMVGLAALAFAAGKFI